MDIIIKHDCFTHIPYLTVVDATKCQTQLPTVFVYHGWQNSKEEQLIDAYEIAKKGYRVIVPDIIGHGERQVEAITEQDFFDIVIQTVKELPQLVDHLNEQHLIDLNKIAITGMSMGGIITCAALTQYDWLKTAAILMGSPQLVNFSHYLINKANTEQLATLPDTLLPQLTQQLTQYDLSQQLDKIRHKSLFFWHDRIDRVVPYQLTAEFIKNVDAQIDITFVSTAGRGHRVKQDIKVQVADFLAQHL